MTKKSPDSLRLLADVNFCSKIYPLLYPLSANLWAVGRLNGKELSGTCALKNSYQRKNICCYMSQGLISTAPLASMSEIFRVAIARPFAMAVAAIMLSMTGMTFPAVSASA